MKISIKTFEEVALVELSGDIDAKTAQAVQEKILPLAQPGSKILMDMTEVAYMSSAGFRVLVLLSRQASAQNVKFVLVGLSKKIQDAMSITGFLRFFTTCETLELGLKALK